MAWTNIPFNDAEGLIDFLEGQVRRKKDCMICPHGGEGAGKSTTAQNISRALEKRLGVKAVTIFTMRQLLEVLSQCKRRQIYILDEAINIFHNQDWSTWEAKALTKVIRQMRIMQSIWILCVPDFEGLHPYLREFRIPIRLYHQPVWQKDGLGNGPAKILFKQEMFGYKEGQVLTRWHDAGDLHAWCLDDDKDWAAYEEAKVDNFKELVKGMMDRLEKEDAKAQGRSGRKGGKARKATNRPAPPIATQ